MAEIAGAVIGAVACGTQCLSPSVGRRFNRMREFKNNAENLKTEIEKLKEKSAGIQRDADVAKKNGDRILENVQRWQKEEKEIQEKFQKWLERASKITGGDKATRKIREPDETAAAKKQCFKRLCPDLKMRYKLSKEAETLQKVVVKHLEEGKFDKISDPVIPKDLRLLDTDYSSFESRTSTLENVISSLSDTNVNIVGIYGMGGVGKTTLAKEVAKQTEASKLFDSVIFVEVTVKPDIMKIQQQIAGRLLDFTFSPDATESDRAAKLYQRLQNEKNILIILDNVWAKIKLEEIGISLGNGSKLLLTVRNVDVLEKMSSQQNFPVALLDDEEAWQLFKKMSRENIEGSEFESVAREVAEKCARLPIVIVTVAGALKNKPLCQWRNASLEMGSSVDIGDIHRIIELSFNYLQNEALKKTILLIRYANMTSIDELLLYGMSLGIFDGIDKMEARRDRLLTLVQQLKDSCLLLESNTIGGDCSMHDIVREVALAIASRERHVFTKVCDELVRPDVNTVKVCHSIVLKDVKMDELPPVLECQQLKLLSVSGVRSDSSELNDEFFVRMTQLKVLVLDRVDLRSLFPSLSCLTNLQALGLYNCQLDDIAIIGGLKKLEILSLNKSKIEKLPVEVGHLARLKSLDLRGCSGLLVIPPNVISSLSHLEELYMGNFSGWEEEGLDKDRKNVSLDKLKNLLNLTSLQIRITDAKTLPKDLFFKKLKRYKITIGHQWRRFTRSVDWDLIGESCRKFELSLMDTNICLKDGHIMQLKGIEELRLDGSQDMESVVYGLDRDGFPQLKYLEVRNNDKVLCIVDSKKDVTPTVFPLLESLSINNIFNLKKICHGQLTTESSFSKLKKIEVRDCSKLKNIFSFSIARRLQLLQSIYVSGCTNMEEIFSIEREDECSSNIIEVIDNIKLSQLLSLRLMSLPQLKSLDSNSNGFSTLFSEKVVLPNLAVLELYQINVESIWQNSVAAMSSGIQSLTKLEIWNCYNLKCLFSSSMIESFDRLQYLWIYNCPSLEQIMVMDDDEDELIKEERKNNVAFSISNIKITVGGCPKLKTLFPWNIYKKFLRLESLFISDCDLLEVIFDLEDVDFEDKQSSVVITQLSKLDIVGLPKLKRVWNKDPKKFVSFEKLKEVTIEGCDLLKTIFPASVVNSLSQSLERLEMSECKEIVSVVEEEAGTNSRFVFPRLTQLQLYGLPKFKAFISGRCTTECSTSSTYLFEKVVLPNLEVLELDTVNVERICRSSVIQNLTKLSLDNCYNLKCLFSSSMIESFDRLQYLYIYNCPSLEEIMVIDDDEDELRKEERKNNVAFSISNIKMTIRKCDKLKTLFPWNIYKKFLRLESLDVDDCDLLEVIFDLEDVDFEDKQSSVVITPLSKLSIFSLPKLKQVWNKDPKKFVSFEKLKEVTISYCDVLKTVFPASVTTSLSQLERLEISKCDVLKTVFPASVASSLSQLERLEISKCEEIVSVVEGEVEINSKFVFPSLIHLRLRQVPKFEAFFSGGYIAECSTSVFEKIGQQVFPKLEELSLEGKSISIIWESRRLHLQT